MNDKRYLRLGVNIDHVATVRNARGIANPDPVRAALLAAEAGADGITAHLREDWNVAERPGLEGRLDGELAPRRLLAVVRTRWHC